MERYAYKSVYNAIAVISWNIMIVADFDVAGHW